MCTFYSKKCGIGCVLSTKEFKNFIKRYYERHPDLSENEIKTLNLSITESTFGERSFKRSDGHGFFTFKDIQNIFSKNATKEYPRSFSCGILEVPQGGS